MRKIFFSLLTTMIFCSSGVLAERIPIENLNKDLQKQIDTEFLGEIQKNIGDNTKANQTKLKDFFTKEGDSGRDMNAEADSFRDATHNNNEADFTSNGLDARNAAHNEVVDTMLKHPNIDQLDDNDPIFTRADEIMADPGKVIGDCKEEKGENTTPVWRKLITRQKVINTEHVKNICEHLQNTYAGYKTLNLKCIKKGKKWGDWQDRQVVYYVDDYLGRIVPRYVHLLRGPDQCFNLDSIHEILAREHNIDLEAIDKSSIHHSTYKPRPHLIRDDQTTYTFNFRYRDKSDMCEQWVDQWEEKCTHIGLP